jgi:hypothetical protein
MGEGDFAGLGEGVEAFYGFYLVKIEKDTAGCLVSSHEDVQYFPAEGKFALNLDFGDPGIAVADQACGE